MKETVYARALRDPAAKNLLHNPHVSGRQAARTLGYAEGSVRKYRQQHGVIGMVQNNPAPSRSLNPKPQVGPTIDAELKILVIDVERLKGVAEVPFWGLSDFKNRRLDYQWVTQWPRTITAAYRWIGEPEIHFDAEWREGGAAGFAQRIRDVMDEAHIITGHYVNTADRKWLNSLFRDHGIGFPSPYRVADTLTTARYTLGDESLTLGALTSRYGIPTKEGRYDAEVAKRACEGSVPDQEELMLYNMADVEASTGLFQVMLPHFKNLPHVAPSREGSCPRCGSTDIERNGTHNPGVYIYARYLCHNCKGWHRSQFEGRGPSIRSIA